MRRKRGETEEKARRNRGESEEKARRKRGESEGKVGGRRRRPASTVRRKNVRKLGRDGRRYKRCGECEEKKKQGVDEPLYDIT